MKKCINVLIMLALTGCCQKEKYQPFVITIPPERQEEARKLYMEVYNSSVMSGSTSWATDRANSAVEKVYGAPTFKPVAEK